MKIPFSELGQYTEWLEALKNSVHGGPYRLKTRSEIIREYDQDKWGSLLQNLQKDSNPTISRADELYLGALDQPYFLNGEFYLGRPTEIHEIYYGLLHQTLSVEVPKSKIFVELGAGYGSIIFKLASSKSFLGCSFIGGELTESGQEIMRLICSNSDCSNVISMYCDLQNLNFEAYPILTTPIFFTSWSMGYIKGFPRNSLDAILSMRPAIVIHVEPVYEYWGDNHLESIWKRYAEYNDYNLTFLSDLRIYESLGLIEIVEEKKNVFGANPLSPVSIIKWRPNLI